MNGYSYIGIGLLFTALMMVAYILLHSHRIKVDLQDQELKRAVMIIRLRNFALILGMLAISAFLMMLSGLSPLDPRTEAYAARDIVSTCLLYIGLALVAIACYLGIVGRKAEYNFKHLLQQYAVKEKLVAILKFGRKSAPKPKRTNRV